MVKGRLSGVCGLLILGLGACGRSVRTADRSNAGDDSDSPGASGVDTGGGDAGRTADMGGGGGSVSGGAGAGGAGGSSIAGSTSGAGAPPTTDSEVCADACTQTSFEIPSALCEDWHFPDSDHPAEYCGSFEATECAERCEAQLGYVSAPCNAALRQAIPCVARSELYHGGIIPPPTECGIIPECIRQLVRVSAECNGLRDELARARALWATAGSETYSYTLRLGTSTFDILVRNGISSVVAGSLTDPPTIPTLFDRIESSFESVPASATYDALLGYPSEASSSFERCVSGAGDFSFGVANLSLE
jgi:hypothetical protein